MHSLNEGIWHNFGCVDKRPHSPQGLVIENEKRICNLGDLTFQRQCDGTFKVTSSDTEGFSVCQTDCTWPNTGKDLENCTNFHGIPKPKCILSCQGDFCLPPASTSSAPPAPSRLHRKKRREVSSYNRASDASEGSSRTPTSASHKAGNEFAASASTPSFVQDIEARSRPFLALSILASAEATFSSYATPSSIVIAEIAIDPVNIWDFTADPATLTTTASACDGQTAATPTGTAHFYVYKGQSCSAPGADLCDPQGPGFVGLVRRSEADCTWFEAEKPAGYNQFYHHDEDGDGNPGPNTYPGNVIPGPEDLTIVNDMNYCSLNDITFEKQCDG